MKITKNHLKSLIALSLIGTSITSCNMMDMEETNLESTEIHSATGLSTSPNIVYQETFEGSNPFSFATMQYAESYGFGVAKNPAFEGTYSGRFELNDTDDEASSGTRAEALFPRMSEKERWYSYTLYLPSADYKIDRIYDIISQWHQGSGTGSPTLTFRVTNDRFELEHGDQSSTRKKYDLGPVSKDRWIDVVFHVVHSSGSDGHVQIWLDGNKVIDLKGGNMDSRYDLPRWKLGIYKDDWNGSETTDSKRRVLFFDNVRLGNKDASFDEMTSMGGSSNPITDPEEEIGSEILPGDGSGNGLVLINTSTDEAVGTFHNGAIISAKDHRLSIVPNFGADSPSEVKFELSGAASRTSSDNTAPFSLNGDDGNGNYWYGEGIYAGDYQLKVTPYYNQNGVKVAGASLTYGFTITDGSENAILDAGTVIENPVLPSTPEVNISSLSLINTSNDKVIGDFSSGATITAKDHRLSIVPNFGSESPSEVKFELSGADSRTNVDAAAPFSMNGDNGNGDFWYGDGLYPGSYELTVTPYLEVNGSKVAGTPKVFQFSVVEGNTTEIS
ncbi:polysaccharide lyase [Echinicola shivajiensis]|uniref:polysaccharide lyase n=1 Tax=Echinicola shivajiensis TaxID=1035916 RepID=UPI001BFC7994|nr:polysaccharide lyase [Echinicola shivajiensis]